ncbi:glycosyltransferase family 2 protein [Leifsonia bigeumensis]|uniref:Glycosyltransferase family 2 protein n=1 Tax=Leifsonella bigeumensis TaxID=433643 RepID=A0ABP7FC06_9MICO
MAKSGGSASSPRLGVVTVSYGSESVLPAFLESVADSTAGGGSVPVVVVDNLPGEGDAHALADAAGAQYLPMASNLGYGAAANAAIAALPADVDWVLISNPDVVLGSCVLDLLREAGDEDAAIASVGPAVYNADGTLYPSARAVPSLRTGVGHAMFANLWPGNPWSKRYRNDAEAPTGRRDAGWLSGSCLLVRRSAFDELGGFDPGYFMYFEDVDLGYRFGRHGYRNLYEPSARVTHTGAHSTNSDSAKMIAVHHTSARRFLARKYSGPLLWPVRIALTAGLTIRSAIIGRRIRRQESQS